MRPSARQRTYAKPVEAKAHSEHKPPKTAGKQDAARDAEPPVADDNLLVQALLTQGLLQPKLAITPPDDPSEREADAIAETLVQRKEACSCGGTCASCREEEALTVQRKARDARRDSQMSTSPSLMSRLGPGRGLDPTTRGFFESNLHHDFSRTRIHDGSAAAESAASIDAKAFTYGRNVVFGRGEYAPHTKEGKRLLAHELTHVVQQDESAADSIQRVVSGDITTMSIDPTFASALTDAELVEQIEIVRRQLQENEPGSDSYESARLNNQVLELEVAERTAREVAASARATGQQVPRPPGLPLDSGYTLIPMPTPPPEVLEMIPEGQIVDLPPGLGQAGGESGEGQAAQPDLASMEWRPVATGVAQTVAPPLEILGGASGGVLYATAQSLRTTGFAAAGENAIGIVAFPRSGSAGHGVLQSRLAWGHTAEYVRINGRIVVTRSYGPSSILRAGVTDLLSGGGVKAGNVGVPASIFSDVYAPGRGVPIFTHTGARSVEYPVSRAIAQAAAKGLPDVGPVPGGQYTGIGATRNLACGANCVVWAVPQAEAGLGGPFGPMAEGGHPTSVAALGKGGRPGGGVNVGSQGRAYGWMGDLAESLGPDAAGRPRAFIGYDNRTGARVLATIADDGQVLVNALPEHATGAPVVGQMSRGMRVLRVGGRIFFVVGLLSVPAEIALAPEGQRERTAVGAVSGFAGGMAFGAVAGLACGPGALVCSVVLGIGFGIAGGFASRSFAELVYDHYNPRRGRPITDPAEIRELQQRLEEARDREMQRQSRGEFCPSCHSILREQEEMQRWADYPTPSVLDELAAEEATAVGSQPVEGRLTDDEMRTIMEFIEGLPGGSGEAGGSPERTVQRKEACSCGGTCASCREEEALTVQRKARVAHRDSQMSASPRLMSRLGSGRGLDPVTRGLFESNLHHDFGRTGIHADRVAEQVMRMQGLAVGHSRDVTPTLNPLVQRQVEAEEDEEEVLQGKFTTSERPAPLQGDRGEAENRTGMPGRLKAGLEALSGMDLSGLRVHKNSSKPAQLDALAYTQGPDIHVGPGQEKHLPHEGWHAVQQMQGRVKPTLQAKGVSINDDTGLEQEADVMGAKAFQMKGVEQATTASNLQGATSLHQEVETKGESGVRGEAISASGEKAHLNFLSADPLEREADEIADAVVQRKEECSCGGTCEECQQREQMSSVIQRENGDEEQNVSLPAEDQVCLPGAAGICEIPEETESLNETPAQEAGNEVLYMSITTDYAAALTQEEIMRRLALLSRKMSAVRARGQALDPDYSTLYNNQRILRDALGSAGRSARQNLLASHYDLPALSDADEAKLRLAIGGTRAYRFFEQRQAMRRKFAYNQRRGMGILNFARNNSQAMSRVENDLRRELEHLGVSSLSGLLDLVDNQIPRMVLARAKRVALGMLRNNQRQAERELARYGQQGSAQDKSGLIAADRELYWRWLDIRQIDRQLGRMQLQHGRNQRRGMGILNYTASRQQQRTRLQEERAIRQSEFDQVHGAQGARYPVLLAEGYRPGRYANATPDQLGRLTGEPLHEVLKNIEDVREDIQDDDLKVWHINYAVATALAELGLAGRPIFVTAVQRHIENKERDRSFLEKVKVALAIVTTLLSGPAALYVGAAWGAYFAYEGTQRYLMEDAAENVALDPEARDISMNEPELLWLVIDIVGAVIDAGAILRALRPLARAAVQSGRIREFSEAAHRVLADAPHVAKQLVASLRSRVGRGVARAVDGTGNVARGVSGAGRSMDEYLDALRAESHGSGSVGGRWDHANQPSGLPASRWEPGLPIDMPNTSGTYPVYNEARQRYWRNRAHFELQARTQGNAQRVAGSTLDPVKGLSDDELRRMAEGGRAPQYAYPNRAGQTWELEHAGVPQRVGGALEDLGFSRGEAARLTRASDPGNLMEVTPLEHAFFDAKAHGFGRLRGDSTGARWSGSQAADVRGSRPLYYMSNAEIEEILNRSRNMEFNATQRTRELRGHLRREIAQRGLTLTPP